MSTAFRLKTFPEILSNMFARSRSLLGPDVDLNPGSVIRTIFEATSLQDADQYVQIAKLLDLFSLDTVQGDDLDRRAADYGSGVFTSLRRRPANTSISKITASDGVALVDDYLAADVVVGASSFTLNDGSDFPTSGGVTLEVGTSRSETVVYTRAGNVFTLVSPTTLASGHAIGAPVVRVATKSVTTAALLVAATSVPLATGTGAAWPASGSVVLDRNTVSEELRTFTRVGDVLTVPATTFAHNLGIDAYLSTAGTNRSVPAGSVCFVPATESTKQVNFTVVVGGTLLDGDLTSDLIDVTSQDVGADTRVGSGIISRWESPPFTNATVTNPISATRGADREPDLDYRQRIRDFIQSLSRATPLAIETGVDGLQDPDTGAVVVFSQIVEPVAPGMSRIYISDGTSTFALDQNPFLGRDVIIRDAEVGDARGRLGQFGPFLVNPTPPSTTPRVFKSVQRGVASSVGVNTLTDSSAAFVVNAYVGMYLKTDDDVFYPIVSNTAIAFTLTGGGATPSLGSYSIFDFSVDPLIPGTDYEFNESTGDLELAVPLVAHDGLVAAADNASPSIGAYTFTAGLGAYAQRVINGDPTDFDDFPGLRAAGTQVLVIAPTVIAQTFTIQVLPSRGFTDDDVEDSVLTAVETYVNSLGIGDNVIIAEIIAAVKNLPNIDDVTMINPTANVTVPDGQIMRINSTNIVIA
jgi:uncharacterized phage protein gp47/JayE